MKENIRVVIEKNASPESFGINKLRLYPNNNPSGILWVKSNNKAIIFSLDSVFLNNVWSTISIRSWLFDITTS
ncbi:hypothetical protein ONA24_02465 [Mycoplasmopsis cynos]|uniref:hypothetical protein n=1 Tax=Mycoplasmopsis cynos TaxID=171284 RepID=UPI0024C76DD5|nr:hypothetical protein [Mycoplasmopsis cynos]WAM10138.1 hypothetical protein ONA24_02465 [Mycoplasmopsis cynos]